MSLSPAKTCRRCRRYRACAGMMLLLCTITCGWFAVRWQRACQQREAVAALWRIDGCEPGYDGDDVFDKGELLRACFLDERQFRLAPVGWAESIFGKHFIHRCETVGVDFAHVDEALPLLRKFPYLRRVVVHHVVSDFSEGDPSGHDSSLAKIHKIVPGIEAKMVVFCTEIGMPEETKEFAAASDSVISEDDIYLVANSLILVKLVHSFVRCVHVMYKFHVSFVP